MVDRHPRAPNRQRIYAGWLCVAAAFALVVALGAGWIAPFDESGLSGVDSVAGLGAMLLPVLAGPVVLFAVGLWLLKGPGRR